MNPTRKNCGKQFRCSKCGKLLCVIEECCIDIKYKKFKAGFVGGIANITCWRCGHLNVATHALILAHQSQGPGARLAIPLLFLCMYPALASVSRQVSKSYDSEGDSAGDLCLTFFGQVQE